MIDLAAVGLQKFDWWQDWRGECVAIIGAGPSAKTAAIEKLRDRIHVIAINESHRLCPWADILYSCDADWWRLREQATAKFAGVKITFRPFNDLKRIDVAKDKRGRWLDDFLLDRPGVVGSGGNGGFQMINLAAQFGATGIALVGFDMRLDGGAHWHGKHPQPLRNPDELRFAEWRKTLDKCGPKLQAHGIDVVNCSSVSALAAFPKMTIEQMLARWGL